MASIDTIADRSTGSAVAGKAYFETSTNKFIVYNGSSWVDIDSDGTGSAFTNDYSLSFDGSDDYMDLGTSSTLSPTSALTISAWIYINGAGTGSLPTIYSSSKSSAGTAGGIALAYVSNKIRFYLDQSGSSSWVFAESNSTMNTSQWYHLAGTWNGSTVTLYVNGTAQTTTGSATTIGYNTDFPATIGRYSTSYFEGLVEEVSLFNSALSSSDIASLRDTSGSNPVPADISSLSPVAWWRMGDGDDGAGNDDGTVVGADPQVYDMAGSNHGALKNGPTFSSDVPV